MDIGQRTISKFCKPSFTVEQKILALFSIVDFDGDCFITNVKHHGRRNLYSSLAVTQRNSLIMYQQLKYSLEHWVNSSEQQFELFLKIAEPQVKKYKRKECILKEGDTCKHLYFINKGSFRYFYNVDGEERTGQFFFENGWYTDLESFLTEQPSEQTLQALEPTELLLISKKNLYRLYLEVPIFERFGRLLVEQSFIGLRTKNKNVMNLNPEERYLKLIKDRPKVIQRIPLQYIASYLGIKPESLSRIRKRIFDNR